MTGKNIALPALVAVIPVVLAFFIYFSVIIFRLRHPFSTTGSLYEIISVTLFFGIGLFSMNLSKPAVPYLSTGQYRFSGVIEDFTPTTSGDRILMRLIRLETKDGEPLDIRNVNALITVPTVSDISYGDLISGTGNFKAYDHPGNFLKQDYETYLYNKNIYLTGFVLDEQITEIRHHYKTIKHLRDDIEAEIEKTSLSSATKGFLIAVLLGDKTYIKSEDRISFNDAGVAHVFAVSGFHVSMIAMFILTGFSLIFNRRTRHWKFLLALPIIWGYIFLVGSSPATCRSGIMLSIGLIALYMQRKSNPLKALAWAIILILSFNPEALFDVGFQLSVVCVGGLIMIASPLNFMNQRTNPKLYKIVGAILVVLTATFSSWILCAYYFHRFSFMFIPLNLIAVPLMPFFIALSLVYLLFSSIGISIPALAHLLDGAYGLFRDGALYLTSVSNTVKNMHPEAYAVFFWIGGLIMLGLSLNHWKGKRKQIGTLGAGMFMLISILSIMLFPQKGSTGMIFQKNSHATSIANYRDGIESVVSLPEYGGVMTDINGKKILCLRVSELSETLRDMAGKADFIILSKGCREMPSGLNEAIGSGTVILTHPTLHWRYERRILEEASEMGLTVHSLRYDGPLHIFD